MEPTASLEIVAKRKIATPSPIIQLAASQNVLTKQRNNTQLLLTYAPCFSEICLLQSSILHTIKERSPLG
jgi:hypothetical protein